MRTTGPCAPFEKEYFRKDGSRVPVLIGGAMFEGRRDQAVSFVLDLTERKRAEGRQMLLLHERQRAEYLTGQVFVSSPDGVCIVGRDYRYQRVNPAMSAIGGCLAHKIVGMHVSDVVGIDVFEQTAKPPLDQCFVGEEVGYARWFTHSTGRRYQVMTHSPLRPDADDVEAALVISRDLTEHAFAAEALRENRNGACARQSGHDHGPVDGLDCPRGERSVHRDGHQRRHRLALARCRAAGSGKVEQALARIVGNGKRAGDVIGRIRALIKKVPP